MTYAPRLDYNEQKRRELMTLDELDEHVRSRTKRTRNRSGKIEQRAEEQ